MKREVIEGLEFGLGFIGWFSFLCFICVITPPIVGQVIIITFVVLFIGLLVSCFGDV